MRDDLNDIKIDENGKFDIQELQTWGTLPIRALIEAIINADVGDDWESGNRHCMLNYLLEEKIIELDECLKRLMNEEFGNSKRQDRA